MKLAMVGIVVNDMEKAIEFYKVFGLNVSQCFGDDYVELANETIRISLNTKSMITGVYGFEPNMVGERIELAFEINTKSELEARCTLLIANGYNVVREPWDAPWGQYYALVEDVDGNILSLFVNMNANA